MPQRSATPATTKTHPGGRSTAGSRSTRLVVGLVAGALVLGHAGVAGAKPKQRDPEPAATAAGTEPAGSLVDLGGAVSLLDVADAIGARRLWAEGITGDGVDVAVIDTGIAPVPGLDTADVVVGPDLSFEAANPDLAGLDTYGHGTHMAGIIGARTAGIDPAEAGPGDTSGIAPGSRLVSVKVGDSTGAVDVSQVIAAIDWVVANRQAGDLDIRVLNLSYNTSSELGYIDDPLSRAVENAWRAGIVVVVSAGNDGRGMGELANPANNPYVIAVAAAEEENGKWKVPSWATTGDGTRNPDLIAPGASIASLRVPGSRIDTEHPSGQIAGAPTLFRGSGTSQAAAVVSGTAALLLDNDPALTPDDVKALLTTTAVSIHNDERRQGSGLVDVYAAANSPIPTSTVQSWAPATGQGSLEAARGDDHVTIDGQTLQGEVTFNGAPWDPTAWTGSSWTGSSWTGSSWTGSSWTGSSWTGSSWTGSSWTGSSWTGSSWTGSSWR